MYIQLCLVLNVSDRLKSRALVATNSFISIVSKLSSHTASTSLLCYKIPCAQFRRRALTQLCTRREASSSICFPRVFPYSLALSSPFPPPPPLPLRSARASRDLQPPCKKEIKFPSFQKTHNPEKERGDCLVLYSGSSQPCKFEYIT